MLKINYRPLKILESFNNRFPVLFGQSSLLWGGGGCLELSFSAFISADRTVWNTPSADWHVAEVATKLRRTTDVRDVNWELFKSEIKK